MEMECKAMVKINDIKRMEKYILKYGIDEIFSKDMRPFMELFSFKKGEYICMDGENVGHLLFLVEGKAKVYVTLSNGKSLLLCFYKGFKVLGDLEIINGQSASTNVQAIEDVYCIGISIENAIKHLLGDAKFLRFVCSSLGEKLSMCSKNSSINLLYPLENRLASYIIATEEIMDYGGRKVIVFNENLTEIAELLGSSYRHLLRTLNSLCEKGVLIKKDRHFEVTDEKSLKEFAADLYR
ncbi:cAMP-binding domain of CRP or a regulatory subunit of cAMP-dependent protein kinases [Peptoclostridium litorale DSM 5388]|uniref:Cyclic nucleotide-binding protein n=2 Tax=Peptoclostridium litorale TaxID=1557 RepID=A0A069RHN3_PEPLI|nr:cyclic nucleotide-binding protein [Peptoclostridium litorale DSM 5388]SIN99908.1 cAMP-binding domain of CRP or a regulatory subunit of cAMP-dependent protein kinases [Peptoclostridium litorale DSM 5388]